MGDNRNYNDIEKKYRNRRNNKLFRKLFSLYSSMVCKKEYCISKEAVFDLFDHFKTEESERQAIYKDIRREYYYSRVEPKDYLAYQFQGLKREERDSYIIETVFSMMYDWGFFNDFNYSKYFSDKSLFAKTFEKYYGREMMVFNKETEYHSLHSFCKKHSSLFIKPLKSFLGKGVFTRDINSEEDAVQLFKELNDSTEFEEYIIEEKLINEDSLRAFHPNSLNTIRINTLLTENGPEILTAYLNLGNNGKLIDAYPSGSVGAVVDFDTGVVCSAGNDKYNNRYIYHPFSGKQIVGYQLKNWKKCIELVKELATVVPQIRLVGWDITLTDKGEWVPVEGNDDCGFARWQAVTRIGLQKRLDKYINENNQRRQ